MKRKLFAMTLILTMLLTSLAVYAAPGIKMVDGVVYTVDSTGKAESPYTGWARAANRRYFFRDGIRHTGWLEQNGRKYYFASNGVMRTGSVMIAEEGRKVYQFDENGVWDGRKGAQSISDYRPKTLGDFLLDCDFPQKGNYGARYSDRGVRFGEIDSQGVKAALDVLNKNADAPLLYDRVNATEDCIEIEHNEEIYRGNDDIIIRLMDDEGKAAIGFLSFSKDKNGNCYFYSTLYSFGAKLSDKDAYDKIAAHIK